MAIGRWMMKAFLLNLLIVTITIGAVILLGWASFEGLSFEGFADLIVEHPGMFLIIFIVIHLIIEGMLIEKVNMWIGNK